MSRALGRGRSGWVGAASVVALGMSVWLTPLSAQAFCRLKACDPKEMTCTRDAQGCVEQGPALFWPSNCITLSVQEDGSQAQGISYDAALEVLRDALATWSSSECEGGGSPSIRAELSEAVECAVSESNPDGMNANILVFRDEHWPYVGAVDSYGYTRLRFGTKTGQIVDADIEINSAMDPFSVGDPVTDVDLASVVTHEVGHLLGLDHSETEAATMYPSYIEGDDSLRSLDADDVSGICEIYPPSREHQSTSCEPRGGFSPLCLADQPPPSTAAGAGGMEEQPPLEDGGCSLGGGVGRSARSVFGLMLALVLSMRLRRRGVRNPRITV